MNYIDTRTYNQYELWKHQGKSGKWLKGYQSGFNGTALFELASDEYKQGYAMGQQDRKKEEHPPHIKDGFGYGYGYKPDEQD